jgi:hypothetical protein
VRAVSGKSKIFPWPDKTACNIYLNQIPPNHQIRYALDDFSLMEYVKIVIVL